MNTHNKAVCIAVALVTLATIVASEPSLARPAATVVNPGCSTDYPLCVPTQRGGITGTTCENPSTGETGPAGPRPWRPSWANGLNRYRDSAHFEVGSRLI